MEGFHENSSLVFPEEVPQQAFENDIDDYEYLGKIHDHHGKMKAKIASKKTALGKSLADQFKTVQSHVTLKADKNDKYSDVAKTAATYDDPNEKRKDTNNKKKREKRAAKKVPPTA